jgi:hypothetical protein
MLQTLEAIYCALRFGVGIRVEPKIQSKPIPSWAGCILLRWTRHSEANGSIGAASAYAHAGLGNDQQPQPFNTVVRLLGPGHTCMTRRAASYCPHSSTLKRMTRGVGGACGVQVRNVLTLGE